MVVEEDEVDKKEEEEAREEPQAPATRLESFVTQP